MKIGIIGSHLKGLTPRLELGYETSQLQKSFISRGHHVFLINPQKVSCGANKLGCFATFTTVENNKIDVTELDVIIIRRTSGMIDEILDFVKFATKANEELFIVDSIESMGRPTSKIESISKRAGIIPQPETQILHDINDLDEGFQFPLISKPMFGTGGKGVVLCQDIKELQREIEANYTGYSGYSTIIQNDITGEYEYRVVVINGVALGCVSKPSPANGVARNADNVTEFSNYEGANKTKIMRFAERVSLFMGQYFSGVDIVEKQGELFVLECNRNPQFQNFDFATSTRTSESIVDAIEKSKHTERSKKPKKPEIVENSSLKKPTIFIGSSTEGLPIAEAVQWSLERSNTVETTIWTQGIFEPSSTAFHNLNDAVNDFDYAIFCLTADDKTTYRELDVLTARDNVIFEAGLFMGALGEKRVFLLASNDMMPKVPTDLSGVNLVTWFPHSNGNLKSALGKAIVEIREAMGL